MPAPKPIGYPLAGTSHYMRRPTGSTLLFSLAKLAAKEEKLGYAALAFQGWIHEDGDYAGYVLVDDGLDLIDEGEV